MRLAAITAFIASLAIPAFAQQQQCGPRSAVQAMLAERYGETVQSSALTASNGLLEVYASTETGTWTITITMADLQSCLVASGSDYFATPTPPAIGGRDM